MLLSVLDGRMAYLQGSYTGYLGLWTSCGKHKCASLGQVTVLIHMSTGFMILALTLCLVLLPAMGFSFRPVFRRLNKADLIFSSLSFCIGLLVVLSLTLFVANCETLQPRPQVSYLVTTYLCWGAGAVTLGAGTLSYLNYVGMWGKKGPSMEQRLNHRRCVSQQSTLKFMSEQQRSDPDSKSTEEEPSSLPPQEPPSKPL
ncbi:transmembrane protein 202-like [Orcinus orca]|uniref:transmembrane protein 202-like n=1 Tax=Orcinus orca TaxID=9733 RepID=UPI0021137E41|nr:transmembrane protein 202-like [Orcinus orca]